MLLLCKDYQQRLQVIKGIFRVITVEVNERALK